MKYVFQKYLIIYLIYNNLILSEFDLLGPLLSPAVHQNHESPLCSLPEFQVTGSLQLDMDKSEFCMEAIQGR